ncbi:MAG: SipW-dependent-type signal peptide-containing protein [Bacillota bacterium]|nr:SipW-dependent-type signal peptide-containing protein [Bacillota bacterium]
MKTRRKALFLVLCAVMLVAASVLGTMAYLTSTDEVKNTFTVGKVAIKLDEAKTDSDGYGVPDPSAPRVQENDYKLIPGHKYSKDPMVTVLNGSELSYIRMIVTVSKADELDAIFSPDGASLISIFGGYDSNNWIYKGNVKDEVDNTRIYTFWYKEMVGAPSADVALDALFDYIAVPGNITNAQLATIEGMTITVNAHAIQADGFANAAAAWTAFDSP